MGAARDKLNALVAEKARILSTDKEQLVAKIGADRAAADNVYAQSLQVYHAAEKLNPKFGEKQDRSFGSGKEARDAGYSITDYQSNLIDTAGAAYRDQEAKANLVLEQDKALQWIQSGEWDKEILNRFDNQIAAATEQANAEGLEEHTTNLSNIGKASFTKADEIAKETSILSPLAASKSVTIGTAGPTQVAKAADVADAMAFKIGDVGKAETAPIGEMAQSGIAQIAALKPTEISKIDQTQQAEFRTGQQGLIGQLQAQATGQAPSLAEAQLKTATNRNLAQQLAIAAQSKTGNAALQNRQLQQQQASSSQELASTGAQLRLKEQQDAQKALVGALESARGGDISIATKDAELAQAAFIQTAADAAKRGIAQAEIESATNQFNTGQKNLKIVEDGKAKNQALLTDINNRMQIAIVNGQEQNRVILANQAKQVALSIKNAELAAESYKQDSSNAQAKLNQQGAADVTKAQGDADRAFKFEELKLKEKQFIQNRVDSYTKDGYTAQAAATAAKVDWGKFSQQVIMSKEEQKNKMDMFDREIAAADARQDKAMADQARRDKNELGLKIALGIISSATTVTAAALSDKNAKKDIKSASKDISNFLSALGAHKYKYKEPEKELRGHGEFVSVMAQELEKTKLGKSMVSKDAEGVKTVDYGKGFGTILAAQVELNKRLEALESKKRKG